MKKIFLTLIAALVCIAASAQTLQKVTEIKNEVDKYRRSITDKVYSIVSVHDTDEREEVVDEIEDIFDELEDYIDDQMDILDPSKNVHKTITADDFFVVKTPTTTSIKYSNFSFFSTPVTYEYRDDDILIRTTPTTLNVSTSAFLFELAPMRSKFKIFGDNGKDTLMIKERGNLRYSIATADSVYQDAMRQCDSVFQQLDSIVGGNTRVKINHNRHRYYSEDDYTSSPKYFYVGINNFLNADDEIDNPGEKFMELNSGRSIELGFYMGLHRWNFTKFMSMDLGVDYRLRHYSFEHTFQLVNDDGRISADFDNVPVPSFKKHNLRLQYLSIPLTMEWRIGKHENPLILTAGIEGSIRIGSREKQVYKIDGDRKVERFRNDFETNLLSYACTFGIGYRHFELYCNYSTMELFKHNRGPELYPISIGVRFLAN
ncbi:MAG: PorT family protein [Bacteroidales bacterium]|nr:PorT family protein [Bacteroidales bacterium]